LRAHRHAASERGGAPRVAGDAPVPAKLLPDSKLLGLARDRTIDSACGSRSRILARSLTWRFINRWQELERRAGAISRRHAVKDMGDTDVGCGGASTVGHPVLALARYARPTRSTRHNEPMVRTVRSRMTVQVPAPAKTRRTRIRSEQLGVCGCAQHQRK